MIVTEEEAAVKWCPFSRNEHMGCANRQHGGGGGIGCCIGSACMEWRWVPQKRAPRSQLLKDADPRVVAFIKAERFIDAIKERRNQAGEPLKEAKDYCERLRNEMFPPMPAARRGYCGLAGKVTP